MPNRTDLLLLLTWTVTVLMPAFGSGVVNSARCRSTCLSTHFTSSTLHTNGSLYQDALECVDQVICSCFFPCMKHFKTLESCRAKCEDAVPVPALCSESCTYVKSITNSKIGACPAWATLEGFERACVEACSHDEECPGERKCCDNGCGKTCQKPNIRRRNYPSKINQRSTVTENEDGASATVRWQSPQQQDPQELVLYAVQMKNISSSRGRASWVDVGVVQDTAISIPLQLGRNYHFRIASVNQNGSLGFSRPTPSFHLSRTPQRPSPPHTITAGRWQVTKNRINLNLHWSAPRHSDLPIAKYRIFYSERRAVSASIIALEEHRLDVQGSQTTCVLPNLLPYMKYFVQVMAIARFGDTRLSSERESKYITTPDIAPGDSPGGKFQVPHIPPSIPSTEPLPGPPRDLTRDDPYWENGTLKVRLRWRKPRGYEKTVNRFTIHWEATVCSSGSGEDGFASTQETTFELYDLSFDCTYQVWVKPVFQQSWGPASALIQILTPPCTEVMFRGYKPVCPTPVPEIPSAPINMTLSYSIGESISVELRWAPPRSSQYPLTGYRIYWAKVKPSSGLMHAGAPSIEREEFTFVFLTEMEYSYTIHNLTAGARYVVKLQALSSIGGGAIVATDIKTPNVTIAQPAEPLPSHRPVNATPPQQGVSGHSHPMQNSAAAKPVVSLVLVLTYIVLALSPLYNVFCVYYTVER